MYIVAFSFGTVPSRPAFGCEFRLSTYIFSHDPIPSACILKHIKQILFRSACSWICSSFFSPNSDMCVCLRECIATANRKKKIDDVKSLWCSSFRLSISFTQCFSVVAFHSFDVNRAATVQHMDGDLDIYYWYTHICSNSNTKPNSYIFAFFSSSANIESHDHRCAMEHVEK